MASIQILEIRPVEVEVEDLSIDVTGSIRGGNEKIDQIYHCFAEFLTALTDANSITELNNAQENLINCLADIFANVI